MFGCTSIAFALLALFIGRAAYNLEVFKPWHKSSQYQKHDATCRDLAGTSKTDPSCEDFRFVSENIILAGQGQIIHWAEHGNDAEAFKDLIAIDLRSEKLQHVELEGFPHSTVKFRPHGLEYKAPDRFFVVNHADNGEERIDVFEISGQNSLDTLKLKWLQVVHPPVPKGGMNSVTAISRNELYVTHWLPFDAPKRGLLHPASPMDTLRVFGNVGYLLGHGFLGLPYFSPAGLTAVFRCLIDANTCTKVAGGFASSNGITSSADGKFVFVVDCVRHFLAVYERNPTSGQLTLVITEHLLHGPDNIQSRELKDGRIELSIGSMPDTVRYLTDKVPIPGGLLQVFFDPKTRTLQQQDVFIHNGKILQAVATGAKWGDSKVLLSGPKKIGGIVICDLEKDK